MPNDLLAHLSTLSRTELLGGLQREVHCERAASARVIAWLVEVERRRLWAEEGYSSLFAYCVEVLGFSEDETCNRIGAARAVIAHPMVLDMLEARTLTMTAARLIHPHLEGHPDPGRVYESAAGKSRREVEKLVAALSPRPDAPTTLRKLPAPQPCVVTPAPASPGLATSTAQAAVRAQERPPMSRPADIAPLSPDRFRLQLTISGAAAEKLELAQDLLSHAVPTRDAAQVLERALDLLLEDLVRRKFAATDDPREGHAAAAGSRHIPAAVKRAVFLRDRGQCAFRGRSGHRCSERRFLEFHHREPFAFGGPPTVENVALRCRTHNQYEAQADFGRLIRPGTDGRMPDPAAIATAPAISPG
jgi:hypothetical protein